MFITLHTSQQNTRNESSTGGATSLLKNIGITLLL